MSTYAIYLHTILIAPLQTSIILYFQWSQLGRACCLASIVVIIVFIVYQLIIVGTLFRQIRHRTASLTDQRLCLMNEIIGGMRVIKMYTWELAFGQLVSVVRKSELKLIYLTNLFNGFNIFMYFLLPPMIVYPCLLVYVWLNNNNGGHRLTADIVFVTVSYASIMRPTLGKCLPIFISSTNELLVVIKRIEELLLLDDIKHHIDNYNYKTRKLFPNKGVFIVNMTARWTNEVTKPTLNEINVCLKPGQLLTVIGPVGSGKSSLLMSVLNEMTLDSGSMQVSGRVSYAPQESWAFIASVRDNILFGSVYDEHRYQQVVNVCALDRDFQLFPFGDRTLVGEKGVLLSGGQKSRISLARALYRQADIYLLDDPLSAVDAQVAKHIYNKCIIDYLKDKACILVTHQIQLIQKSDKILELDDQGRCIALGNYDKLRRQSVTLILYQQNSENLNTSVLADDNHHHQQQHGNSLSHVMVNNNNNNNMDVPDNHDIIINKISNLDKPEVKHETKMIGSIDTNVYWDYIKAGAGGPLLMLTMISMIILSQTLYQGIDCWLSYWTNQTNQNDDNHSNRYIIIYSALIVGLFVTSLLATLLYYMMCMRSSKILHKRLFQTLLRAPIHLFEHLPAGRILNRFSKDIGSIDEQLPSTAFDFILKLSLIIGKLVINAIVSWLL
ncbi:ATP-binding cassette sub-family C member 4-like, partial [Oppia nitens]|uniref:ATP-binding cassette sub-family C member 4-like n=1 Tax=Oppia nitens TaxID=1686743 RepID=UPI0023D9A79E